MKQLSSNPAMNPAAKSLPVLLRHSWYALNQAFRRRIAHLGLTPDQYTVLRNLSDHPGLTQRELCARMASDPNTVASLTARMETEGWIERKVCPKDRRANRLRLLPAGKRKFAVALPIATALREEVSHFLQPDELQSFLNSMSGLATACHAALHRSPAKQIGPPPEPAPPTQREG
jgi:DNA-binding MarR family transcriptional regulator